MVSKSRLNPPPPYFFAKEVYKHRIQNGYCANFGIPPTHTFYTETLAVTGFEACARNGTLNAISGAPVFHKLYLANFR